MNLKQQTHKLMSDLQSEYLERGVLYNFYKNILAKFNEIKEFENCSDFQYCALLLTMMLDDEGFTFDVEERQKIATIGYYILSKGLFKNIYNESESEYTEPSKSSELANLLGVRLSILQNSSQSIKFSLTESGVVPFDRNWTSFSNNNKDDKFLEDMKFYDAFTITEKAKEPYGLFINSGSMQVANSEINGYEHSNSEYKTGKSKAGFGNHKKFFKYLEERFEVDRDFNFS